MKKLLFLTLTFICQHPLVSQQVWFPDEAIWTFTQSSWGQSSMMTLEVMPEDTIINEIVYRKLAISYFSENRQDSSIIDTIQSESTALYRQEGNKIYAYWDSSQEEQKIYDFDLVAGDTISFINFMGGQSENQVSVIDSVGEISIDNQSLRFQDIRTDVKISDEIYTYDFRIVEKIGHIGGGNNPIAPPLIQWLGIVGDFPYYEFNCYHDHLVKYSLFPNVFGFDCEELMSNVKDLTKEEINVYPNPTNDFINFENIGYEIVEVKILSIDGRALGSYSVADQKKIQISINNLNEASFLMLGINSENEIKLLRRIIKVD